MHRFNSADKVLHVGLAPEHASMEMPSLVCKFLDIAIAELPDRVLARLEQNRHRAVALRQSELEPVAIWDTGKG